jgi:hypothetical protein
MVGLGGVVWITSHLSREQPDGASHVG